MSKENFKRKPIEVSENQLRSAPWNPRADITDESVADLAASIGELGLIQRIVVIADPEKKPVKGTDFYMIVAGHRRFRAWCASRRDGLIPCELLDCGVEQAKRMTLIENLQRKDVDPLMEADLISGLVESGMTEEEIAAETGRGNKWVWRRKQLVNLSDVWREESKKTRATVDCLERISRYAKDVQEKAHQTYGSCKWRDGSPLEWRDVSGYFNNLSCSIRDAGFKTDECLSCPYNTATQPLLFDLGQEKNPKKLGECTNKGCFVRKTNEKVAYSVQKLVRKGEKVREANDRYSIRGYVSDKRTKANTVPYLVTGRDNMKEIVWAQPLAKAGEPTEEAKAEKAAAKAYKSAKKKVKEWISEKMESVLFGIVGSVNGIRAIEKIVMIASSIGADEAYVCPDFKMIAAAVTRYWCDEIQNSGEQEVTDPEIDEIPVKKLIRNVVYVAADGEIHVLSTFAVFRELIEPKLEEAELKELDNMVKVQGFGHPYTPERLAKALEPEEEEDNSSDDAGDERDDGDEDDLEDGEE